MRINHWEAFLKMPVSFPNQRISFLFLYTSFLFDLNQFKPYVFCYQSHNPQICSPKRRCFVKRILVVSVILLFATFTVHANTAPVISSVTTTPAGIITGKTAVLKAVAKDDGGETNLVYTWSVAGTGTGVTFSQNGNNAAKTTTATFTRAGFFITTLTVKDKGSPVMTSTSTFTLVVQQMETTLNVWPTAITTPTAVPRKFTSTLRDQFGARMQTQYPATWSISGGGSISGNGSYGTVMTSSSAGTATITAKYTNSLGATIQGAATLVTATPSLATARQYIKNVFIIMQENRSFDNYFGKYQGANGFARIDFTPTHHHNTNAKLSENDYLHIHTQAIAELAAANYDQSGTYLLPDAFKTQEGVTDYNNDCFGYHNGDANDLCNYWAMADSFVLQDAMFQSCKSYSKPEHCYLVSGWSASLNRAGPYTDVGNPEAPTGNSDGTFGWHSIATLLPAASWTYYKGENYDPACGNCDVGCFKPSTPDASHAYWLPMSRFNDANINGKTDSAITILLNNLKNKPGSVPKVCWISPGTNASEHPGWTQDVRIGQAYVTTIVKAIMSSSVWNNSVIYVSWDDWGGHYDHAIPPYVSNDEMQGWGLRVPGLMLSPYAKKATGAKTGWVDHEQYSHDAYLKLIEDLFCNSNRIDWSDGRYNQRETLQELGNLLNEFDFGQAARTNTTPFRNKLVCKNYQ
jgi:phospholipase C